MTAAAQKLASAIRELQSIRRTLSAEFKDWNFTLDGKLVGDIGEAYAISHYQLEHLDGDGSVHDFKSHDGRLVQVKITQKDCLGLGLSEPSFKYLLAFTL